MLSCLRQLASNFLELGKTYGECTERLEKNRWYWVDVLRRSWTATSVFAAKKANDKTAEPKEEHRTYIHPSSDNQ